VVLFVVSAPLLEAFLPTDRSGIMTDPDLNQNNESIHGEGSLTPEVNQIIKQVLQKNDRPNELNRLYLISRAYELLFQLFAAMHHSQERMLPQINQECIERAIQILRENLTSPPKLADIARQSGICTTSLNAGFKKHFGTTVFGFLRRERLSKAKYLITHEHKSASEAAWDVGYSSLSSFHRAFYAQYGVTPGFYSKNGG
jgi:AraC-like DNA-binding protein